MASSSTSSKDWPQVTSRHHPSKLCVPCFICGKQQPRYAHLCSMRKDQQTVITEDFGAVPQESCMCRSHCREADRCVADPEYVPTWKRETHPHTSTQCMHPECNTTSDLERVITATMDVQCDPPHSLDSVVLCETHYQSTYRVSHSTNPCAGCGARPKARQRAYSRHSPDATTVSQHLQGAGFDTNVAQTDTLCKSCYDTHRVILQSLTEKHTPNLKSQILLWREVLKDQETTPLTKSLIGTVIFVAKKLQEDRALLLPHVATLFLDNYPCEQDTAELYLELDDSRIKFSPRWLMNQLIIHLQPYMSYKCVVKKLGTLLYAKNSDPLKSLSLALNDAHCGFNSENPVQGTDTEQNSILLKRAGNLLNDVLHDEIRKFKSQDLDLTTFDLGNCITSTSTLLWEFVCSCTRSVRERTGRMNNDDAHVKKVRRFFLVCMLLFATNPSCDTILHHLVAEAVEVFGGSRKLLRILNRLGVCVSADTHDRLVTAVAERKKSKGLWSELLPYICTIFSADNIDFLQSDAAVFCGDQSRSYHGTTMQAVQPLTSHRSKGCDSSGDSAGPDCTGPLTRPHNTPHSSQSAGPTTSMQETLNSQHQDPTEGPTTRQQTPNFEQPTESATSPPGTPDLEGPMKSMQETPGSQHSEGPATSPPVTPMQETQPQGPLNQNPSGSQHLEGPATSSPGTPMQETLNSQPQGPLNQNPSEGPKTSTQLTPNFQHPVGPATGPPGTPWNRPVQETPMQETPGSQHPEGPATSSPGTPDSSRSRMQETPNSQHPAGPATGPPGTPSEGPTTSCLQLKRQCTTSPFISPHQLGKIGPKRPRTMELSPPKSASHHEIDRAPNPGQKQHLNLKLRQFLELDNETACQAKLQKEVFAYCLQKLAVPNLDPGKVLKPLREFILPTPAQLADHDPSNIYYMELLNENADSEETMSVVSEMVLEQARSAKQQWVVLVGDGKTYEHLQKVKRVYGSACENLIIFPGDWHILKNFQPVLMKAYYHASLKDIAKASGYRAETLTSLENCSHFKRTHSFLLQVWEALFIEMVVSFTTAKPKFADLLTAIQSKSNEAIENNATTHNLLLSIECLVSDTSALKAFREFVADQAKLDDTWLFWSNFVLEDCFSYVCFFLAIRHSCWDLRLLGLKSMSTLFSAYDRPCYQKILPNHIADIQSYPTDLIDFFRAGGFTVKLLGGIGHAVALDEAHEMCINRDMKMAVTRPTPPYLKKMTHFFSYRIKAQKQLSSQLFPAITEDHSHQDANILDSRASTKQWDQNVNKMRSLIHEHKIYPPVIDTNRGILNVFTGAQATPEQRHDLLNARAIGQQIYTNYVTHHILQVPSAEVPLRKRKLLTMAPLKITKTRLSQKQKEERDTNKYLRRRLAWCNQTGLQYDESEEQYSLLPRALADSDGSPHTGSKSNWTDKLQTRYSLPHTTPFMTSPPWVPQVVIIDTMFAININPLRQHKTVEQYAYFLFEKFAAPHYRKGTGEVHFLFDHPKRLPFNPKECEHNRRYSNDSNEHDSNEHTHIATLTPHSPVPRPWREYLHCRQCKRSIVEALGCVYLCSAKNHLQHNQTLILAGCFSGEMQDLAWRLSGGVLPELAPQFNSNALESDMRIWRHATQSEHQRVLIYCPDTDVYNIGLALAKPTQQYVVQINPSHATPRYIDIHKLLSAFQHDPDLASLSQRNLGNIMLQLYVTTGCDYISFVSGQGKATLMKYFFQHAEFITGAHSSGCLSQTKTSEMKSGFLAFLRLIGTAYFKKNLATVVSRLGFETPNQLFNSLDPSLSDEDKHREWYISIKRVIHVLKEEHRPPTHTALWRHWMRSCWIKEMWSNSTSEDQYVGLALPETQGWLKSESGYMIDWEAEDVQQKIKATLDFLNKGCACKTGCKTKRCSCRKNGRQCGASCECRGCTNMHLCTAPVVQQEEVEEEDREEDEERDEEDLSEIDSEEENLEVEVVTDMNLYEMEFV